MATITIDAGVKQELKKIGRKGESYNDIVRRLLGYYSTQRLDAELNDILKNEEFTSLDLEKV